VISPLLEFLSRYLTLVLAIGPEIRKELKDLFDV